MEDGNAQLGLGADGDDIEPAASNEPSDSGIAAGIYESSDQQGHKGDITDRLHADDLAQSWMDEAQGVPQVHCLVRVGFKTDLGVVRENNEDKFDLLEPADPGFLAVKGRFYGVADGMGGHSAGQIASELALKTVIQRYFRDPSPHIIDSLRQAINEANKLVFDTAQLIPERQGMGTTLTVAVLREDRLTLAHVGDSRAYLVSGEHARQITHDHSLVAEQVRAGTITAEDAANSPLRNIILRSIGTGPIVEADFYEEIVHVGDVLVMCSDGLTGHVSEEEIAEYVGSPQARRRGPSMAAYRLVDLANSRGGRDNITVVIVEIASINPYVVDVPATASADTRPVILEEADHTLFAVHSAPPDAESDIDPSGTA
ncbi:MAG: Stp1/IreP family PP2C-type Ser/Thr phosphatase [Capsulimonadaceae bacterium]|nr:Stp1/IreP family PP2C-type Ser/Thr phosphatase [Capsulimonadaceae bacterium]